MANPLDTVIATLQNGVTAINEIDSTVTDISATLTAISTTLTSIAGSVLPWTAYTPSITAAAGTFTTVSATGRFKQIGKVAFVVMRITITTNNTAASFVIATLPIAGLSPINFYGRANAVSGKMLQGIGQGATSIGIFNYDTSYPGADGEILDITGIYEAS